MICCQPNDRAPPGPLRPHLVAVLQRFAAAFWAKHGATVTVNQRKALQAILLCRTPAMGGHRFVCGQCGLEHFASHSCNHRLCPRCGAGENADWVRAQLARLLPVSYYLITVTLPEKLRTVCLSHSEAVSLFFQSASQALKELFADTKRCRFTHSGFLGVYQSWDQQLNYHPHIHFVVPAIGLSKQGRLVHPKTPGFLIYAQVVANRLRTLYLNRLKDRGLIGTPLLEQLRRQDWIASVAPAGSGENAVKYLGKYVARSVIGDNRILSMDTHTVTIQVKDRDEDTFYPCTIDGVEFVRRFLLHALPTGFHRIRHYGFLHTRAAHLLHLLQLLLDAGLARAERRTEPPQQFSDICLICPRCRAPMHLHERRARAPPALRNLRFLGLIAS